MANPKEDSVQVE